MRKIPIIISSILFVIGLALLFYDAHFIYKYGYDMNEVAGIIDDGPIDWPTGERPAYANYPAFVYAAGFCLTAVATFLLWPKAGKSYRGRICRGTE